MAGGRLARWWRPRTRAWGMRAGRVRRWSRCTASCCGWFRRWRSSRGGRSFCWETGCRQRRSTCWSAWSRRPTKVILSVAPPTVNRRAPRGGRSHPPRVLRQLIHIPDHVRQTGDVRTVGADRARSTAPRPAPVTSGLRPRRRPIPFRLGRQPIPGTRRPAQPRHVRLRVPAHARHRITVRLRKPGVPPRTWRPFALVEGEQVLDAISLRRKALPAVETIDRAIQRVMRPSEVRRHQVRVVEVRQRGGRVGGASVEDGLGEQLQR